METSPAKKAIDANRGKVAPFVTNQLSLHDHQPQKINGKTYKFSASQMPNLDRHDDHPISGVSACLLPQLVFQLLLLQDAGSPARTLLWRWTLPTPCLPLSS